MIFNPYGATLRDMTDRVHPWEPLYGFMKTDREFLAAALEAVRRRNCAYMAVGDGLCDCKYGIGRTVSGETEVLSGREWRSGLSAGSEQTGCPELRSVIHMLLHGE